jgi:polyhydroxyalkanoate synthesis repressor PhaR
MRQERIVMSEKSPAYSNGFGEEAASTEADVKPERASIVIKKYANRRLYNTDTSTYVTLDDLASMVRSERDFVVFDARTGEDLTHTVLTQIIVEQESKGNQNLLPIGFLRQLIRFYGNSMERLVPSYLEYSLDTLTREQEKYRQQFADTFGSAALDAMQDQTRKNLAIFERALNMFAPFTSFEAVTKAATAAVSKPEPARDQALEIADLKSQLASIQSQLTKLADQSR